MLIYKKLNEDFFESVFFSGQIKKTISKFVCDEKKVTFVAFHFYFLLDLFQTALSIKDFCSFFILKLLRTPTLQFRHTHLHLMNAWFPIVEFQ